MDDTLPDTYTKLISCHNYFFSSSDYYDLEPIFEYPFESLLTGTLLLDENPPTCSVCHKLTEIPLKRRKNPENLSTTPPLIVCEECCNTNLQEICCRPKRASRKHQVKQRHEDSEAVKKLKKQQEELMRNRKNMPESQAKKLQQLIRNRLSAQQSRDRKKDSVFDLELENAEFKQENSFLLSKLKQMELENKYLKAHLVDLYLGSEPQSCSSQAKAVTLTLATILSIMLLVPHCEERNFLDLEEFTNKEGVSIKTASDELLKELNISLEDFIPQPQETLRENHVTLGEHSQHTKTLYFPKCEVLEPDEIKTLQVFLPIHSSSPGNLLELTCPVAKKQVLPLIS